MGALALMFGAIILTLNLAVHLNSVQQTENIIDLIAQGDGFSLAGSDTQGEISGNVFSDSEGLNGSNQLNTGSSLETQGVVVNSDDMRARRFFFLKVDNSGTILEENYSMMSDFSKTQAEEYLTQALISSTSKGQIDYYYYGVQEKSYGKIVVFVERRVEMGLLEHLTSLSLIVAGVSFVLLFFLSLVLSRWMVAPIQTALEKQRRFTSDANHELKTPLTIISANVDVLNREVGKNERFAHIRKQIDRMNALIERLLALSKTEDVQENNMRCSFDLSKAVLSTALEFESRAFEDGRKYLCNIIKDISYFGDEEKLKSLVSILIDNALKHSHVGSTIKVSLSARFGKPILSIYNTGEGVCETDKDKLFDRFYRTDTSRARETGGYGLGLSIAKSIADEHKAKIKVNGEQGKWIEFVVSL